MLKIYRIARDICVILLLVYMSGIWWGHSQLEIADGAHYDPIDPQITIIINLFSYLVTGFIFLSVWKKILFYLNKDKAFSILTGLALLSFIWSQSPSDTFQYAKGLIRVTLFSLSLGAIYSTRELFNLFRTLFIISLILCFVAVLLFPEIGVDLAGDWRGVFFHKNHMGIFMVMSFLLFFNSAIFIPKYKFIFLAFSLLSSLLVVMANSAVSLGTLASSLIVIPLLNSLRYSLAKRTYFLSISLVIILFLLIFIFVNSVSVLEMTGDGVTLNGRIPLWSSLFAKIAEKPFLGYGYSGFWPTEFRDIWAANPWEPSHAHNAYIELTLDLGLVGLILFLIHFCQIFTNSTLAVRLESNKRLEATWYSHYLIFFTLTNLATTPKILTLGIYWIIYVAFSTTFIMNKMVFNKINNPYLSAKKNQ